LLVFLFGFAYSRPSANNEMYFEAEGTALGDGKKCIEMMDFCKTDDDKCCNDNLRCLPYGG
ncbi:Hypothetical predicted protein, partial [Paramuricea clavata]